MGHRQHLPWALQNGAPDGQGWAVTSGPAACAGLADAIASYRAYPLASMPRRSIVRRVMPHRNPPLGPRERKILPRVYVKLTINHDKSIETLC